MMAMFVEKVVMHYGDYGLFLIAGDEASLRTWKSICAASRKEFAQIYERLGVKVEERGESFYNPMLKDVVEELKEKVRRPHYAQYDVPQVLAGCAILRSVCRERHTGCVA